MTAAPARRPREAPRDELDGAESVLARVRVLSSGGRLPLHERDQLVFELVLLYREGPRRRWAPVLLEVMAPPLFERLARFRPQERAIEMDDVVQQLSLEVLETALVLPLHTGAAWLERRLLLRAAGKVSRWLRKEARLRSLVVSLEETLGEEDDRP